MGRIGLILAATLIALGCTLEPVDLERSAGDSDRSHHCIGSCDHIIVEGGWKVVPRHHHGPECGHVLVDGQWVKTVSKVADPPKER